MDYARAYMAGSQRADDGATLREHWERAAARGSTTARARLRLPEFPEELGYLWEWGMALHGRSGVSMAGINPLTFEAIEAWARLHGCAPSPLEVEGLLMLDSALRPSPAEDKQEAEEPRITPAWPEKKESNG